MKAGCIANQLSEWEKITSDPQILSPISRPPQDFSEEINHKSSVTPSKFSPNKMFLSVEIKNLVHKEVTEKCQHKEEEYISQTFLTRISDYSFRMK